MNNTVKYRKKGQHAYMILKYLIFTVRNIQNHEYCRNIANLETIKKLIQK